MEQDDAADPKSAIFKCVFVSVGIAAVYFINTHKTNKTVVFQNKDLRCCKYEYKPFVVHPQQVWSKDNGNVPWRHLVHLLVFSQLGQEFNQISVDDTQPGGLLGQNSA